MRHSANPIGWCLECAFFPCTSQAGWTVTVYSVLLRTPSQDSDSTPGHAGRFQEVLGTNVNHTHHVAAMLPN